MDSLSRHEDYGQEQLAETDLGADPLANLADWVRDADVANIFEPNAFVLGTIDADGRPSSRTVLLKLIDDGLVFVTNYESRKGRAIAANPRVTAVFPWYPLYRQVVVEGSVQRVSAAESDEYFASRPHGSQVAAWASNQSQPIASRDELDEHYSVLERDADEVVERPPHWGGYRIIPDRIEFWKGRSNRMHDRIVFTRDGDAWTITRLQP